jgi:hypothetical protein
VRRETSCHAGGALTLLAAICATLAAPAARAQTASPIPPPPPAAATPAAPAPAAPPPPAKLDAPPPPPTITVPGTTPAAPVDAEGALERARNAYEYGEMDMVVDSARLVAEGRLHPTPAQRAQALRYLGIGLYLTERHEGAETAFLELLRLKPTAKLDPTTTRPDVVTFFEGVRRRHSPEIKRPSKSLALAFLPPLGQFQAGHNARGITIAALEVLSLGGAIATNVQLHAWDKYPGHTFDPPPDTPGEHHSADARILQSLNYVSVAVFAATVIVGIIDGVASYAAVEPDETAPTSTSLLDVLGGGLRF